MPIRQIGSPSRRRLAVLAGLGALLVALVLSACGSSDDTSSSGGGGSTGEEASGSDINLAVVTASTTQNAFQEMTWGAEAAADHEGVNIAASAPNGVNPPEEVSQFQAATHTASDGITVMTTAPELFLRPYKDAVEEGVPVATMDAPPPEGSDVNLFVGNDNIKVGEVLAEKMLDKLPDSGEVVIGNDIPGLILLELRIKGMENVLKKEKPGLTIEGPFSVGSEPAENYNHWNDLVKAHPDAVAYLAPGDQDAVSWQKIQKATGKKFLAGACDVDPIALEAVKNGYVYALGDPWHFMKGYISASLLAESAKSGEDLTEGWWNPGQGYVTSENVDEIIKRETSQAERVKYFQPIAEEQLKDPSKYLKPLSALG
jgi:ABC-type sugar transport system substrate-binding protein